MASSEQVLDLQLIQNHKSLSNFMGPIENQNVLLQHCLKLDHLIKT